MRTCDARLMAPPLPPRHISRGRLLAQLDESVEKPLTLVSAGPGSGKTVLLSEWAARRSRPPVWMSLDPAVCEPVHFWPLLAAAVRVSIADTAIDHPVDTAVADDSPGGVLEKVLAALADLDPPDNVLEIVLDDAQLLTDQTILTTLDRLLHRWQTLRLVFVARHDPVLPLHRYRLAGRLSEIRTQDLAATRDEAQELLAAHGVMLPLRDLEVLATRTEGWIAGVRICAMRMEGKQHPAEFVGELALDHGSIGEYLIDEILDRQTERTRALLTRTSILTEVSGPLAAAVTGIEDAGEILRELSRTNSFVMTVDRHADRFRYHELLAEILRYLLRRESPALIADLHRRAARWFEDNGDLMTALSHAASARDWEHVADLLVSGALSRAFIDHHDLSFAERSGFTEVDLAEISPPLRRRTQAALAGLAAACGRTSEALAGLRTVDQLPGTTDDVEVSTAVELARFRLARRGCPDVDLEQAVAKLLDTAPSVHGDDDLARQVRPVVQLEVATRYFWHDHQHDEIEQLLKGAAEEAARLGLDLRKLECLSQLTLVDSYRAKFSTAAADEQHALAVTRQCPHLLIPPALHLARAVRAIYQADPGAASRALRRAAAVAGSDPEIGRAVAVMQGVVLAASGQIAEAREQLLHVSTVEPLLAGHRLAALVDIETTLGRPHAALDIVAASNLRNRAELAAPTARAHLATGDPTRAENILRRVLADAGASTTRVVLIDTLVAAALTAQYRKDEPRAVEMLVRALELADGEIVVPFVPATEAFSSVLARHPTLRSRWPAPVTTAVDVTSGIGPEARSRRLPDPLTDRERAVLRWLATTMSTAEIADEMCVSVNTVKTHIAAVYRKLAAARRRDAVLRARELELL